MPVSHTEITLAGDPAITVEYNAPCTMPDGTVLRADIYRPGAGGPWPVLLMRLPYDKTAAENISYSHPAWYARQGYLVVVQDCRGRWASEGEFEPFANEASDGKTTIEWAAALPGSDGRVVTYGFSYAGATQLLPATLRPAGLTALAPAMTGSQYHDHWTYTNGALNLAFVESWSLDLARTTARGRGDDAEYNRLTAALFGAPGLYPFLPVREFPPLDPGAAPWFRDWLDHPTPDDYWNRWSIEADYARIMTPALHIAGWYDIFLTGSVRNFVGLHALAQADAARGPQKLVIGPWFHMPWLPRGDRPAETATGLTVDDWQIAFFDHVLRGKPTPLLDAPVTVYVVGEGRWRDLDAWPPTSATMTAWYLHGQGRANSSAGDGALAPEPPGAEPPDIFTYDPLAPVLSQGGQSCCYDTLAPMGPADQGPSEQFNFVLVYTSEPMTEPLDVIGDASVTLHAASSAVDTDFTARLCAVDPDGLSINLKAGIVRARYRDSLTEPSPIEPNRVYAYEIPLGPVGFRINPGHRLRLTIASSDFPQWDLNLNTGGPLFTESGRDAVVATQTVLHDALHPSALNLPVIRG